MKLELPAEPVDGYVVEFFELAYDRLRAGKAVYHVNTPWSAYCLGDKRGGRDLVDSWMLSYRGSDYGRLLGWSFLIDGLAGPTIFATQAEAAIALAERLAKRRDSLLAEASDTQDRLDATLALIPPAAAETPTSPSEK